MFSVDIKNDCGTVDVQTTVDRGHTPEELAGFAVEKIIQIADSADPVLKQQAHAFREKMYWVIVHTAKQAIKSDRTTLSNNLVDNGQEDLAKLLRTI